QYHTHTVFDIEGNVLATLDHSDRTVMSHTYDMLKRALSQTSMDAGTRKTLLDVAGNTVRAWDGLYQRQLTYDLLRRPLDLVVTPEGGAPTVAERTEYGEALADATQRNLRGKTYAHYDAAGLLTTEQCDFKGNVVRTGRQYAADYSLPPDWSASPL